ncbi:hypothetical protein V5O48_012755, partial [Marasmius crinis-equi]
WIWSFIGTFGGISVQEAVFTYSHYFTKKEVPSIVASFGATAVLIYGAIDSPLAQPRALFGGHFIGALVGVSITKLFLRMGLVDYLDAYQWLAGSLSTATALVLMQMTKTVHPPAGATALLAAVNEEVRELGWYFLGLAMLSASLAFAIAILVNNIQRRWPVWWIAPGPPPGPILPVTAEPKRIEPQSSNASFVTATDESGTTVNVEGRRTST